jgi:hypothetical protein
MSEVISRKDALARGLTKYITGKPCKHGHIAERRTDTGNCIECQRLRARTPERKEDMRLYYAKTKSQRLRQLGPSRA